MELSTMVRWLPPLNFVTLHYAWILFMGLLSLAVLLPGGNLAAIDAYFFGASASTESGLNTVDVKDLMTYQQAYLYFIPIFTNLGFINAFAVLIRFYWFRKHIRKVAPKLAKRQRPGDDDADHGRSVQGQQTPDDAEEDRESIHPTETEQATANVSSHSASDKPPKTQIIIDDSAKPLREDATLYIPGPRDRDQGHPLTELTQDGKSLRDDLSIHTVEADAGSSRNDLRKRHSFASPQSVSKQADSLGHIAKSILILDSEGSRCRGESRASPMSGQQTRSLQPDQTLELSRHATLGRNSSFHNLTKTDWERLGGLEYRSLKLLLKIVFSYFFGLHLFGAICLIGWIQYAPSKYTDYLSSLGQDKNWWAFYSAQTMVDNLGFTLTPDSMITFRDAPWPMFVMSFLAFAGNTLYPVFLRLTVWTISKLAPKKSSIQQPLSYLLDHPRRCYTLLFPSRPTWILFGIIFTLNFIDTILIIVLDLKNPEVAALPVGKRILAAIFQAASSRHTGTSTFNLANVNPAVQFSLMVMMYIAIFPIAISIRASNTYEEKSLGIYSDQEGLNESDGRSYLLTHIQNQMNFDLWYIFLGIFCICIAESKKIADINEPAFTVWTVFFEVTSAYGNVGLSLGYPTVMTSLSGMFGIFSKLVICAMMIRGRHRGLPYCLDRAVMLPNEDLLHLRPEGEE